MRLKLKIAPVAPVPPATEPTTETTAAQTQSNELTFDDLILIYLAMSPRPLKTVLPCPRIAYRNFYPSDR